MVYALANGAVSRTYLLPARSTAADALRLAARDPEFAAAGVSEDCPVGVFGRVVAREQPLEPGDRLEIYRPLAADPKTARRARVREARRSR